MMEISQEASNKIRNLSIICAFLVIIIHCRPDFEFGSYGWFAKELLEGGVTHMAVPFFFVIPGFFVGRSLLFAGGYKRVVLNRIQSLLIPFFFFSVLYWLYKTGLQNALNFVQNKSFVFSLITLPQLGLWYTGVPLLTPLWYVRAIFVLVLISPIIMWGLKRIGVTLLVALFLVYLVVCPFAPLPNWGTVQDFARVGILPVLGLFYFSFGIWLYMKFQQKLVVTFNPVFSLCIGCILIAFKVVLAFKCIPYCWYLVPFSIPFLLYGAYGIMPTNLFPRYLVRNAFAVFLVHRFVLLIFVRVVNPSYSIITYFLCAILTFAICIAMSEIMRKIMPKATMVLLGGR